MVDPKKAEELIRQHFNSITTEQFLKNLERSCPEVFEEEREKTKSSLVKETKVYQEAFEEGKE